MTNFITKYRTVRNCFKRASTVNTLNCNPIYLAFQGSILKHWSTIITFLRRHFIFLHLCFVTLWFTVFVHCRFHLRVFAEEDLVVGKCLIEHIFLCYIIAFMKGLYSAYKKLNMEG